MRAMTTHTPRAARLLLVLILSFGIAAAQDTPPSLANFGWFNQGSMSVATNPSGTVTLFHPGAAGLGFNWGGIASAIPAAPYTIVAGFDGHIMDKSASLAFALIDVVSGKLIVYSTPGSSDTGVAAIAAWKMTNATTYAGSFYYSFNSALVTGGILPKYIRIKDTGAFRTVALSHDKEVWFTISIVASNDFMTPTHFGYTLRGTGNGIASLMTIRHQSITTP